MVSSLAVYNASMWEMAWTLLGIAWFALGVSNLRQANRDLYALNVLQRNGYLRTIAVTSINKEWIRLGIYATEIIVGVAAMLLPSHQKHGFHFGFSFVVIIGLIVINILVGLESQLERNLRKDLEEQERMLREQFTT